MRVTDPQRTDVKRDEPDERGCHRPRIESCCQQGEMHKRKDNRCPEGELFDWLGQAGNRQPADRVSQGPGIRDGGAGHIVSPVHTYTDITYITARAFETFRLVLPPKTSFS